jgi:hypothetical protein
MSDKRELGAHRFYNYFYAVLFILSVPLLLEKSVCVFAVCRYSLNDQRNPSFRLTCFQGHSLKLTPIIV